MGVPLIAGLAASAIGTGMQMAASRKEQAAMNQQAQAELSRQQGYRTQAGTEFQQSLAKSGVTEARKEIGTGTQNLADAYKAVQNVPVTLPSTPSSPSARSVEDVGTQMMNVRSDAARAKLGGYSEFDIQQMIKNVRAQQNLGIIGTNARASAGVSPYEIQAGGRSAEGLRGMGGILSALGSLASVYGAMGAAAPAAAGAAAPAAVTPEAVAGGVGTAAATTPAAAAPAAAISSPWSVYGGLSGAMLPAVAPMFTAPKAPTYYTPPRTMYDWGTPSGYGAYGGYG